MKVQCISSTVILIKALNMLHVYKRKINKKPPLIASKRTSQLSFIPSFFPSVRWFMAFPFMKNHIVEKNPKVKRSIAIKGPSSLNLILGSSGSLNNALQFGHFIAFNFN